MTEKKSAADEVRARMSRARIDKAPNMAAAYRGTHDTAEAQKKTTVYMPLTLHKRLQLARINTDQPMNSIIIEAVRRHLDALDES